MDEHIKKKQNNDGIRCALTWAGKKESGTQAQEPSHAALLPCPEDSVNWGDTRNLYIEGDNIDALKLLRREYAGAIQLIYIDPPYNTRGGFVYRDDYAADRKDTHSEWLSMMYPRLLLARELLAEDGSLFLSINENELFHLKLLCDEVFGEENYMTTFSVKVRHENRILKGDKDFHEVFEYLLMYRRSKAFRAPRREVPQTLCEYVWRVDELTDASETLRMDGKTVSVFRPGQYRLVRAEAGEGNLKRVNIRGALKEGNSSGRFYMKHLDAREPGLLFKVPEIGDDGLGFRYFLKPETGRRRNGDYFQGIPKHAKARSVPYPNFLDFEREFNRVGLEGGIEFRNGKKPVAFLERVLELGGMQGKDGIVLDFFAGSASTAEAVMRANARWERNNRFIMVQIDEDLDEIAQSARGETQAAARRAIAFLDSTGAPHKLSELGKERLRRAGTRLREEGAEADTGFRTYRLTEGKRY